MSYNGIGLSTVRGSGTNGYVQRNLSAIRRVREKVGMVSEDQAEDARFERKPNLELLEHDRKRRVELKCMELQDMMEEQGYDEEEITKKVNSYRQMLSEAQESLPGKEDASGRPVITETHQIAEMKEKENETLREAFGIKKDYVKGSAFNKFDVPPAENNSKQDKPARAGSKSPSPSHNRAKKKNDDRERRRSSDEFRNKSRKRAASESDFSLDDDSSPERQTKISHSRSRKKSERKERKRSLDEYDQSRKKSKKKAVSDSESSSDNDSSPARHSKKSKHSKHHKKKEKHSKRSKSSKHKKTKKSRRKSYSDSSSDT